MGKISFESRFLGTCLFLVLGMLFMTLPLSAEKKEIIFATTTSTQDTGLLDELVPRFEKMTGYVVKTVAVGSGQALAMGRRGEADVLLVHSPLEESMFMVGGFGIDRRLVMHNDFLVVGPPDDTAKVKGGKTVADAFKKIASAQALFVSRGDKSGTHSKELAVWKNAGIDAQDLKTRLETGLGMGQTLMVASEKKGYTLTDRATFLVLKKNLFLEIMVEGDPSLLNIYHVIQVNPENWPKVNGKGAKQFADFLVSKKTQDLIGVFGVQKFGSPLFIPDAGKEEEDLK